MTRDEIMATDSKELYPLIYRMIALNPREGLEIIEDFKSTDRYTEDCYFRISVDSANLVVNGMLGRHETVISLAPDIIERSSALELWKLVATNWNNLGTTYSALQILDRALECYCHVVNTESKYGNFGISAMAYYNLSSIFYDVGAHEKSIRYIEKAIDSLNITPKNHPIAAPRNLLFYSLYLQLLCRVGRLEQAHSVYEKVKEMAATEVVNESLFSYRAAEMYYYFYTSDRQDCMTYYDNIIALVDERDEFRKFLVMFAYIDLCMQFQVDERHYESLLLQAEEVSGFPFCCRMVELYGWLRDYYLRHDEKADAERVTEKYIDCLRLSRDKAAEQQLHSLETVEALLFGSSTSEIGTKNVELKLLADEAIKTKQVLEVAYRQLEKMSSLDGLTRISSRRDFEQKFMKMLTESEALGWSVSVFMMDIDCFKVYNDTYGHLEGDEVLKKVAKTFREHMEGRNGLAARFGGEEFIGACSGLSREESRELAVKICEEIYGLQIENRNTSFRFVTVSIGVSFAERFSPDDKSQMLKLADVCLYEAKNGGRNQVVLRDTDFAER